MNFESAMETARRGELYPAVILHGSSLEERLDAGLDLARVLLCVEPPERRPCGACGHCRRILAPSAKSDTFHPDFHLLERDLKTATSVDATKRFLRPAFVTPFEARGQVFILAQAETLTGEAANALLKVMEEPPGSSPRHFLLLAPSARDLLDTVRSRSLSIYLGAEASLDRDRIAQLAEDFATCLTAYLKSRSTVHLLSAAGVLERAGGWDDPRSARPWMLAAASLLEVTRREDLPDAIRPRVLALAEALLVGPQARVRRVSPGRILEGLASRHLGI